jgi:hypothetical protein
VRLQQGEVFGASPAGSLQKFEKTKAREIPMEEVTALESKQLLEYCLK